MTSSLLTQIGNDISGEAPNDISGWAVSLSADGSLVAIGATNNNGNGNNSGHIRIYKNETNNWTQVGSDINGEANYDEFGYSVSLSDNGNVFAVGAHQNLTGSGYVSIYQNVNGTWTKVGSDIEGEKVGDNFGRSVSLSSDGSVVAIGALLHEASGSASGHVRIYKNINNVWIQIGSDIDGEDPNSFSGRSVSLSSDGSIVAIGADWNDGNGIDSGHVRIYKNVDNNWIQIGGDIDGEAAGDRSGWAVSLSADGSLVAIGATNNDGNGIDSGHVRIYKNIDNNWIQLGDDIDGEAAEDNFGISVSLSSDGSLVAIGAFQNDGNGIDSGHVRIYKNIDNNWIQLGDDIDGEAAADNFGISVSLSSDGSILAVGAPGDDGNGIDSGQTKVYRINLDSTAPIAPSSLSNSSATNDNTPTISGIAEVGSTVKLYNGDILLGSAKADSNGIFFITSSALNDGSYSLTAIATDAAGNTSQLSSALSITVNQNLITGDFDWARLIGSSSGEEAYGISIDNQGNIFLTGATMGNLNGELNNGGQDIFLLKLDSNGNELWTKLFGSDANEIAYGISIDNDSNIFVTGTTEGNLNDQINNGDKDAFVIKLDSNGNILWTKLFGTALSDIAWKGTLDENIYLWGETHGNLNGEGNNSLGKEDAFLIKLDLNGNEIWTTLIGTELNEEAWDIAVTDDNSVYLVGETQDSNIPNNDTDNILVSKIDSQGNILWSKSFGEEQKEDRATSIDISADGGLYVSGFTESDLNGQSVNGSSGSFLIKLDKDGNDIWTKIYGTANRENAFDMGIRSDGFIYLTGMSDPNDMGFLKKIDLDGNEIWTKYFGNDKWDFYRNLFIDENGPSIYISGETRGDLANSLSNGETDAILYKFFDSYILNEFLALNYIASNSDLIPVFGINTDFAISHYENFGKSEGRSLTTFKASDYLAKYSDLSAAFGNDETLALKHYIQSGYAEGRTDSSSDSGPSSGSSSVTSSNLTDLEAYNYIASNNDLISAFGVDIEAAKTHYENHGKVEGRNFNAFNATNYLAKYSDLSAAFGNDEILALKHYIQSGYAEGRTDYPAGTSSVTSSGDASNLNDFQALNYIASHGDLINAFGNDVSSAISHYTNHGKSEGRILDNFDEWGYLASNNDLIISLGGDTTEAVKHYISFGYSQGKITSSFDAQSYLSNYADLRNIYGDNKELATKHYVEYGFNEGRAF